LKTFKTFYGPHFHFQIDIRTKEALAPSVSIIKAFMIAPGFIAPGFIAPGFIAPGFNGFFNP